MSLEPGQLVDLTLRIDAAAAEWRPGGSVQNVTEVHGGHSSLTLRGELALPAEGQRPVIVKVAPPSLAAVRNRDVLRQARILRRLSAHLDVPVPAVLFEGQSPALEKPPFFVMELVDGDCFEPLLDRVDRVPPVDLLIARGAAAARLLVNLHEIPVSQVFPESSGGLDLAREVVRWAAALDSAGQNLGTAPADCRERLMARLPDADASTVVHGDYRLGNLIFRDHEPAALIDWEICAVGDPRLDLAWLCCFTDRSTLPTGVRDVPGLSTSAELVSIYEDQAGRSLPDMGWFEAFTSFKQAAVTALLVKHNRARESPDEFIETTASKVATSLENTRKALGMGRAASMRGTN